MWRLNLDSFKRVSLGRTLGERAWHAYLDIDDEAVTFCQPPNSRSAHAGDPDRRTWGH